MEKNSAIWNGREVTEEEYWKLFLQEVILRGCDGETMMELLLELDMNIGDNRYVDPECLEEECDEEEDVTKEEYNRMLWEHFSQELDIQNQGILVCMFLAREIKTIKECIRDADDKTGPSDDDKRLLESLIESRNWVADVTENEDLREDSDEE